MLVYFLNKCFYINDLKVVDSRAVQQITLLQLIISKSIKSILNDSEEAGLTWYEIAFALEAVTRKSFNEQAVRQLIHDTKMKIKRVCGNKKVEIIENINGRYIICEKVALILPPKR